MKWTLWIKAVETDTVPKTRTSVGMYLPIAGAGKEELGQRIIEIPMDPEGTEVLRNPHSDFLAYVPVGSIQKGKEFEFWPDLERKFNRKHHQNTAAIGQPNSARAGQ